MNLNIKGKRILLIGGLNPTADLIDLAHRNGVFVGVADYNKDTYLKQIADAHHEVDALDIEAIAKLCEEEHYDGIISNFNDMLLPYMYEVAERLDYWVPYMEEQFLMSTNKKYFKKKCMEYGVPVPKEYAISTEEDIYTSDIDFPVIIKPVDGSGSKGVTPCFTREELAEGYKKCIEISRCSGVIIEQYIPYDEINVTYIAQDGDVQLAAIHDRYFNTSQEDAMIVPDLYIYPSRYTDVYLDKYNQLVIDMLKGIGVKNGSLFMQACVKDGEVYFYEAGMRLNGCKTYQILEYENDYNTFEHLILYALTGSMGEFNNFNPKMKRWYATLNVLGEPGETIQSFKGIKELESYPWLINIARRFFEGDTIPADSVGTLMQVTTRIHLYADTKEELIERIDKVNELYQLINTDGRNVILAPHDLKEIYKGLNYDLG